MNNNNHVSPDFMNIMDKGIGESEMKSHKLLSCALIPRPQISDLMTEDHRSVRSFGSTRLLPSLYPSPGKLPGRRKRRVNASNGPNSHSQGTPERSSPPLALVTPIDFVETSPVRNDFTRTSPSGDTLPIRNIMPDLTMTPPRVPVQTSAFGSAAPATPEITTFKNMSLRSPFVSNSPGSSFSQYINKPSGFPSPIGPIGQLASHVFPSSLSPGQVGRLSYPSFQSSPSPRQVCLKILSNCASSRNHSATQSISDHELSKPCLDDDRPGSNPGCSPQESQSPPTLIFSSRVSPIVSYARCSDNRETIAQDLKQPWPILDNSNLTNEAARPPLTPPLLTRRMLSSDHSKKSSPITNISFSCATKQSTIKKDLSFPANPRRDVSERARNHIPRNINITQNSRVTKPMKRQDSMTFSDDDSCHRVVLKENKEGNEPPIKMLSLGQRIGKNIPNSNVYTRSHHKSAQKSLSSPGLLLSNETLDAMLYDASGTDGNDTVGSLSDDDDDEGLNSFFLTSSKRCFDEVTLQAKETVRLDSRLPPQDYGILPSKRLDCRKKRTRISPSEDDDWILSSKVEMNQGHYQDNNENMVSLSGSTSDTDRESFKNDKLRRQTIFSNMDVICEHSVSNASLVGMVFLPNESTSRSRINIRSCSESSRSSSDGSSSVDRLSSLRRNQSDQNLNSLGLCLEGVPLYSELNSRDTVTPPCIRNDSLTPPLIKKTNFGAVFYLEQLR